MHQTEEILMTYKELLSKLHNLTPQQLQQNVTVMNKSEEEYYAIEIFETTVNNDILDANHPFLSYNHSVL